MSRIRNENDTINQIEPEDVLWVNFINGDDACYEIIYKKYAGTLFQYGIQFTKDEGIVKDAIHDVFVKIYSNRTHLKTSVDIKFYLFAALKNCLYNLFKREMIFEKLDEHEVYDILDATAEDKVIEPFERNDEKQTIVKVLGVLTERQREAVYYRYIQELKIEEIGALMDMNYQSVQNLIQRSIKKMKDSVLLYLFLLFIEL